MAAILILAGLGFLLLLTEMFLPGGILGALGALVLIAAMVVGYMHFGPLGGTFVVCVILVCALVGFCIAMATFPRTAIGRRMTLDQAPSQRGGLAAVGPLVGSKGVALTMLRPAGKALIEGRRLDVVAEGEFVEADANIVVIASDGSRTVVRKKA